MRFVPCTTKYLIRHILCLVSCYFLLLCCFIPSSSNNATFVQAQQAPFFTNITKFDTSVQYRQDLCPQQRLMFAGNVSLSQALSGLNLSVVLLNYEDEANKPFFTLNDDGVIDPDNHPLLAILLDELARRAGFQWRYSYGVVRPLNASVDSGDADRTYSDLLAWAVDSFDLVAGKWDRSITRMQREVAFPEGWYDSSMVMIYLDDTDPESLNIWSFLWPFQWSVWFLLIVSVVVTGVVYWFLERLDTTSDERRLEQRPGQSVYYTALVFTGHFEFRPQTTAAMILTFSTTLISLVVIAVYTANLASFLVARRVPTFTIQSVEQAVMLRAPICVEARVNIDDYLSEKYPSAVLVRKDSKIDIHTALRSGQCMVAVVPVSEYEQYSRYKEVNSDCTLQWNGKVEQIVPSGFASDVDSGIMCSSLVSHVLDLHFIQMKYDGFIERQWQAHLQKTGDHNCIVDVDNITPPTTDEETYSLGLDEMAGIFIIHLMMLVLAVAVALLHYWRAHYVRKLSASQRQIERADGGAAAANTATNHSKRSDERRVRVVADQAEVVASLAPSDSNDLSAPPSFGT